MRCPLLSRAEASWTRPQSGGETVSLATTLDLRYFIIRMNSDVASAATLPGLAAAAGGAAAFADVAAAGRAHLGAAGEAERSVRGAALLRLDQLGRAVRGRGSGRQGRGRRRGLS